MKSNLKKVLAILLICLLLVVFATIVYYQINHYVKDVIQIKTNSTDYCTKDSDCVPSSCCHSTSCTNIKNAPNCKGLFCTQECSSVLDCGQSSCACIDNKCDVKANDKLRAK